MIAPSVPAAPGAVPPEASASEVEAAVRWRISAAVADYLIVLVSYLLLCLVLHWQVATVGHLWVMAVGGVLYHAAFEAAGGQTIGKHNYGIRVVSLDGSPASVGAVTIRSVLRIIDQLPVLYLSGLVSMVRTGPTRRQRIGDVAAGTKVVAEDRFAARAGTPSWLLPTATLLALAFSALGIYGAVDAGKRPLNDSQRAEILSGCEANESARAPFCECFLNQLEAAGYNTPDDLRRLVLQLRTETVSGTAGPARTELISAVAACRSTVPG